uniref:EF-hand calcium binding domain 2 n=1 Tax=Poecilia mexicana TaxID=48701 RepID=A0A3B3YPA6_9TELE
ALFVSENENILAIHRKITAAFEPFDYESKNMVDVREIGTIMYSLDCFPTQLDIREFIAEVRGVFMFTLFIHKLTNHDYVNEKLLATPSQLTCLPQMYENEQKGFLKPEELTKLMMEEGEPFTQEEMDEMLTVHTNRKENVIYYDKLINKLTADAPK